MSDYSTTAQVNLQINGQQPQQTLTQLSTRAYELQNALAKAAMAGDKVELRKLRLSLREIYSQGEIDRTKMLVTASDGQLSSTLSANAVALASYSGVMKKLVSRLDEPFVTVNTVTGDTGIKKAQDDYDRLMRNKTNMRRR